jgi:subtilisin family serine protease/Tol biopolymer transport system component
VLVSPFCGFLLGALIFANALLPRAASAFIRLSNAPEELIVRLRSQAAPPESLRANSTTAPVPLDSIRARYNLRAMEPVFPHATSQRPTTVGGAQAALPDLTLLYLLHTEAGADLLALQSTLQHDPNVEWVEPNYLYHVDVRPGAPDAFPRIGREAILSSAAMPNDPFFSSSGSWGQPFSDLWGLFVIDAPAAWPLSQGAGVVVAVVDTGIDLDHKDLAANVWHNPGEIPDNGIDDDGNGFVDDVNGWDFTHCAADDGNGNCLQTKVPGPDVSDRLGHGTHVAGIIAAVGNNGVGIVGVAPQAHVMAVKGLDDAGFGTTADLAAALGYAADNGAQVINASWEGAPDNTIALAIQYVLARGAVVVAAAGNDTVPIESGVSPADIPEVIAVGALTHTDTNAFFSNFGGPLALVAPGGGDTEPASAFEPAASILSLLSRGSAFGQLCDTEPDCRDGDTCNDTIQVCAVAPTVVGDEYVREAGTSMAAPHVSGVAALVRSRHPEFTRQQTQQVLFDTADDLGSPGWDPAFGYGRVNAARAVAVDVIPVAEITTPANRTKVWDWQFPLAVQGNALSPTLPLQQWQLTLRPQGGGPPTEIGHGSVPVPSGTLATLQGAQVQPGSSYVLELTVEDVAGHTATDTKTFLLANPPFALIPLPNADGGQSLSLRADGTRLAVQVNHADDPNSTVWVYDTHSRQLTAVDTGEGVVSGWLTPDGRLLSYNGFLPSGKNCDPAGTSIPTAILYDVNAASYSCLRYPVSPGPLDAHGTRMAFTSRYMLDPTVMHTESSYEAFLYDVLTETVRQITQGGKGPVGDTGPEVENLSVSLDGTRIALDADVDLDPPASTGGNREVFIYDDTTKTVRQLTGRSGLPPDGLCPSLSGDGQTVALLSTQGLFLMHIQSGTAQMIVDGSVGPSCPQLSADSTHLAFGAQALDVDPTVENEDLNPEMFLLDVATGVIHQITDTQPSPVCSGFPCTIFPNAIDTVGDTVLVSNEGGVLNGLPLPLNPPVLRVVPRQPNLPPHLVVPATIVTGTGTMVQTALQAVDPGGFPLTFFVQLVPFVSHYPFFPVLNDHGDGTADMTLTPGAGDAGTYTVRVAVFNEVGGVAEQDVPLVVEGPPSTATASITGTPRATATPSSPPPPIRTPTVTPTATAIHTPAWTSTPPASPTETLAPSATPTPSAPITPTRTATGVDPVTSSCAIRRGSTGLKGVGLLLVLPSLLMAGRRKSQKRGKC